MRHTKYIHKKILKFYKYILAISLLPPLGKGRGPSIVQT